MIIIRMLRTTGCVYGFMFKLVLTFSLFNLILSDSTVAQHFSDAKIKSAYLVQFAQNILWPNENEIDTFTIAIFSENLVYIEDFNEISRLKTLKEKPVKVFQYISIEQLKAPLPNLLYIDNVNNDLLPNVFDKIGKNPTLVITDDSKKRELVMINFIYSDTQRRRISFEVNSTRIEEDFNLTILPRLLLLGGSKIDVAELYLKQEEILKDEREQLEKYRAEIQNQEVTIRSQNENIERQRADLENLRKNILVQQMQMQDQKKNLDSLYDEISKQQIYVNENERLLKRFQDDINYQREQMEIQMDEMEKRSRILEVQQNEIQNQQERIDGQKYILEEQSKKIQTQKGFLLISITVGFLVLGLFFFIYRSFQNKKRANRLLEEKNQAIQIKNNEILQQKEEIQSQAELLAETNKELEKLSIVASRTDNGVAIMSSEGVIEWINLGFTRLTGYTLADIYEQKGNTVFELSSHESIRKFFAKCIETKESIIYETSFETKSKEQIWLQTTLTPIFSSDNSISKVVAIDSNITEIKKAHQETISMIDEIVSQAELIQKQNDEIVAKQEDLEKAQKQLMQSEKMASIGVLTAGIAHEINNPINFVYAGVNSIMRDFLDVDQVLQIIRDIEKSKLEPVEIIRLIQQKKKEFDFDEAYKAIGQTMVDITFGAQRTAEIVQGLRNFSRSEKEEFGFTNINKIVEGVLVLLKNKYKNHIEIVKDLDDSMPAIECKMGKMNQVLMNLVSNSIDAIKEKGTIYITSRLNQDKCTISVRDDGVGISENVLPKIFDPFFTTKEVGHGTGLGLSISYGIIEEHNGTIKVKSKPGEGTEFIVTIPTKQS